MRGRRNGVSVHCVRDKPQRQCLCLSRGAGRNEILAEHYETEPFRLPMTITVVDQKNEVAVVEIDDGGNIVRH